ncbi:MAG: tetratricopeptide repeat protein [Pirellula sp.]
MVRDYFAAGSVVDRPAALAPTIAAQSTSNISRQIGPYKLRELLGEGGMGSVYVAEQERPVRRKVALKIIKPGMGSREVISRFESERQALALMDHPNIARVLDAGTTENGLPYFVMELVKGVPITEHCDNQKLQTRDRLELFMQVCHAIQHAHQKGIIHRDIKPSNVIVAVHDVTPVVKVIDFGVAKAIGQQLTDNTLYTAFSQMVGTPLYMSPEQAGQSSLDIDTRSDVYSLGILLYELLTGNTPFDKDTLKQAGFDEMRRIIREVDPPKPSARVSTLNAEAQSTVAGQRQIEPRKLSQQIRGELDWIVMKSIEKDRNRRYESANSLAKDVERFLDDLPVEASPPSTLYRIRKLARRHRIALISSAAMLCIMVVATALSTRFAIVADSALIDSERNRKSADAQRMIAETQQREANRLQIEAVGQRNATQQALYKADIRLAGIDYRDVNALRLHKTLKTHIPAPDATDMRAWEWHYLLGASHQETAAILGHRRQVEDVDWSPDGKHIASTGNDGILICDAASQVLIYRNEDGSMIKAGGAWSPDSRHYAWGSAHTENLIRIWDSLTNEVKVLQGHTFSVTQECWNPDGRRLLSVSFDKTCRIWDVETRECLFVVEDVDNLNHACWNPTRNLAAIARSGGGVLVIDPTTGEIVTKTARMATGNKSTHSVAFSTDGTKLIFGDSSGRCIVHDVDTWKVVLDFHAHEGAVRGIAVNPKYPSFATCGADGVTHVWRQADGKKHSTLFGHDATVNDVDWDPTGLRLVTGSTDQRVLVWDVLESPTFHRISIGNTKALAIDWDADSKKIVCTTEECSIATIDLATRKVVNKSVQPWQFESDKRIKSSAMEEFIEYCDREPSRKNKQPIKDSNGEAILWSGDESKVVTVGKEEIQIWDARNKTRILNKLVKLGNDAQWSPDHRRLAVAGRGQSADGGTLQHAGWVYIFDAVASDTYLKMRLGSSGEEATAIAWNPGGTRIVAGNLTGLACIWDAADGKLLNSLTVHQSRIRSFAWSPDSKRIASADDQGQVKILDAETLEELLTLTEGAGGMKQLAWSPDGLQLAGIHTTGNVVVWNASRGYVYSNSDAFKERIASENNEEAISKSRELNSVEDSARDHCLLGDRLGEQGKLDEAVKEYREAIRLEPEFPNAHNGLGNILAKQGNLEEAIAEYRDALKLKPFAQEHLVHANLGNNLWTQGKLDEAMDEFREAIRLEPKYTKAHLNLGTILGNQGKLDEAIAELREALQSTPLTDNAFLIHNNLGHFLSKQGMLDEAITEWREAIKIASSSDEACNLHNNLGLALSKQGKLDEAIDEYRDALRLKPNYVRAINGLAWLLATSSDPKLRDPAKAVELAMNAVQLEPPNGNSLNTLGVAQYRSGRWKEAIDSLEKSIKLSDKSFSIDGFFLAMAYWQLDEKSEARTWYDQSVDWMDKNKPNDDELRRFRAEAAELLGVTKELNSVNQK